MNNLICFLKQMQKIYIYLYLYHIKLEQTLLADAMKIMITL